MFLLLLWKVTRFLEMLFLFFFPEPQDILCH